MARREEEEERTTTTTDLKKNTSKYRGVCWHKPTRKWKAEVYYNGKSHYLGVFSDERTAAEAYDAEALEHQGDKAKTNFDSKEKEKDRQRRKAQDDRHRR